MDEKTRYSTLGFYSAGIRFHAYPKGSDRFTNGHGDNWSLQYYWNAWHQAARHTHTQMYRYLHILFIKQYTRHVHAFIYFTHTYLFMYPSSPTHLSGERTKGKTHCAVRVYTSWNWTSFQGISKAIKHFLVSDRLHLDAVRIYIIESVWKYPWCK